MTLYLAVTRRRIGELPDDGGAAICLRDSDRWMADQSVKNPAALSRMIAPGFADDPVMHPPRRTI